MRQCLGNIRGPGGGYGKKQSPQDQGTLPDNFKIIAPGVLIPSIWAVGDPDHPLLGHSRLLFCPQHTSTLGSVFGDAYYEQQMTARQANALSRQVSGCRASWGPVLLPRPHGSAQALLSVCGSKGPGKGDDHTHLTSVQPTVWSLRSQGRKGRPQLRAAAWWELLHGEPGEGCGSLKFHLPSIVHPSSCQHDPGCGSSQRPPHSLSWSPLQLEQFNMMENAISSSSLYSPGATLNYSQAAMMGLSGSHGGLQDPQQLGYTGHGGIPNIILTGEANCLAPWGT